MFDRPSINDVRKALKPLADIPRPDGDNEGDPINGETVYPLLSFEHKALVRHAEEVVFLYARTFDGQVDHRAVNTMTKNGFPANLGPSQYDEDRLVGSVTTGDWSFDISDPRNKTAEDYD